MIFPENSYDRARINAAWALAVMRLCYGDLADLVAIWDRLFLAQRMWPGAYRGAPSPVSAETARVTADAVESRWRGSVVLTSDARPWPVEASAFVRYLRALADVLPPNAPTAASVAALDAARDEFLRASHHAVEFLVRELGEEVAVERALALT